VPVQEDDPKRTLAVIRHLVHNARINCGPQSDTAEQDDHGELALRGLDPVPAVQ